MKEASGWRLSVEYTFMAGTTVDDLDARAGGHPRGAHGLTSHEVNGGPRRTTLLWEYPSFEDAKKGLDALEGIPVVANAHLVPPRGDRILHRAEYEIRASDARAGRALCVSCGHRIQLDVTNEFALAGARAGGEVVLRCRECSLPMEWLILAEA